MAIAADVLFEVLLDPIRVETTRGVRATIDHWSVLAGDGNGLRQTVARALVDRIVDEAWQWAQENTLLTASSAETNDEPPSGDADDSDSGD